MDKIQVTTIDNINILSVEMDKYLEKSKYLMTLAQDNGLIIQKYYWKSILDETHIEYFEPKIYDMFIMCIDIIGDLDTLKRVVEEYKKVRSMLEKINLEEPLTQEEIKQYSMKFIN